MSLHDPPSQVNPPELDKWEEVHVPTERIRQALLNKYPNLDGVLVVNRHVPADTILGMNPSKLFDEDGIRLTDPPKDWQPPA